MLVDFPKVLDVMFDVGRPKFARLNRLKKFAMVSRAFDQMSLVAVVPTLTTRLLTATARNPAAVTFNV